MRRAERSSSDSDVLGIRSPAGAVFANWRHEVDRYRASRRALAETASIRSAQARSRRCRGPKLAPYIFQILDR
jgi:hypothetical protein